MHDRYDNTLSPAVPDTECVAAPTIARAVTGITPERLARARELRALGWSWDRIAAEVGTRTPAKLARAVGGPPLRLGCRAGLDAVRAQASRGEVR